MMTLRRCSFSALPALLALSIVAGTGFAVAEDSMRKVREVGLTQLANAPEGEFCSNIRDDAQERRYALKMQELHTLKKQIESRIVALENKRAELEAWQKKSQAFAELADESLVEIYSKMRPDAAAGRLEMIQPVLAAALILKMPRRKASVVLNEMAAAKAAKITEVIAASTAEKEPS